MKPIGKDFELIKTIRKSKNKNVHDGIAYIEQIGILEKFLTSKIAYRFKVKSLLVCTELVQSDYAKDILDRLIKLSDDVYEISKKTYDLICEKKNNAGIFAVVDFNEYTASEFKANSFKKIIVMDGLETPGNVGTIFRSADACGFDAVICVDLKTMVYASKCMAASRGMIFEIPSLSLSYDEAKEFFTDSDYTLYLCEPEDGKSFDEIEYNEKCAIVVGSERFGINDDWFNAVHKRVFIPMMGSMTSLNVGVAASLIMYQAVK